MGGEIKKNTTIQNKNEVESLINSDFAVLDEYFCNGFNVSQAYLKIKPNVAYTTARAEGSRILSNPKNKEYISKKRYELSINANVTINDLVNELKTFAFVDITQFLGLSESEVKQLPNEQRRAIKKVQTTNKTFVDREGGTTTEIKTIYEINDKIKAIDMLGKHLGIYEVHNQQKQKTIDLTQATPEQLNAVLILLEQQKETNEHQ
jgi:phage terminase small subunit